VVNLETTNWLLGVMAVASVVQTLMIVGLAVAGYSLYRQLSTTLTDLESRHVAPLRQQVDGILTQMDGVLSEAQAIAARVSHQTERVDQAINGTIGRVDETTDRIKDSVRDRVAQATGVVRAIRAVIASVLTTEPAPKPPRGGQGPTVMEEARGRL
jgi:uncharacterized protein YoxC